MSGLEVLLEDVKVFQKYYEKVRIVDPLSKKVLSVGGLDFGAADLDQGSESCYNHWSKKQVCNNCISMRAMLEDDTFIKFETANEKLYMITSLPVRLDERVVVIELLKIITNINVLQSIIGAEINKDPLNIYTSISRLNEIPVKDELTNLYNRKYINERLPVEMMRARLENRSLSMIMVDIDFFKSINDEYGHVVGDQVLQAFAAELERHIRQSNGDWVARYGGDEFLICLVDCDRQHAYEVAKRIIKAIERMEFVVISGVLKITASLGIHTSFCHDIDMTQLIDVADKNMYRAKRNGRNRVVGD